MTEQEWLQGVHPTLMLDFGVERASSRKIRLFAVACCRRIWRLIPLGLPRQAVEMAELYADKKAKKQQLDEARAGFADLFMAIPENDSIAFHAIKAAGQTLRTSTDPEWLNDMAFEASWCSAAAAFSDSRRRHRRRAVEEPHQIALLHDIFGPLPFCSIVINPAWLTWHDGLLISMARQMDDSRDFASMPILADALEEAGCTDSDILAHCRSRGEHVRGCWVVDLLLGKS